MNWDTSTFHCKSQIYKVFCKYYTQITIHNSTHVWAYITLSPNKKLKIWGGKKNAWITIGGFVLHYDKKTFHDLTFKWFLIGFLFQPFFLNHIQHIFRLTGLQELNMTTFKWHFYKQTTKWKTFPSFLPVKRNLWTQFVFCTKWDLSISAGQGEHPWFSGFFIISLKKILWHYESENLHMSF